MLFHKAEHNQAYRNKSCTTTSLSGSNMTTNTAATRVASRVIFQTTGRQEGSFLCLKSANGYNPKS